MTSEHRIVGNSRHFTEEDVFTQQGCKEHHCEMASKTQLWNPQKLYTKNPQSLVRFILIQASQTCMSRLGILMLFIVATDSSEVEPHQWNILFFKFSFFFFPYKKSMVPTLLLILEE